MSTVVKPNVDIGPWVSEGWKLFSAHWATWCKMAALAILPAMVPATGFLIAYVGFLTSMTAGLSQYGPYAPSLPTWPFIVMGVSGLLMIGGSIISIYFTIGMWKAALKQARGGVPEMSDLKGNGHLFGRVLLGSIVVGLLTFLGMMLCYIPGFIVMGWYMFVVPLIVDQNLAIGEAMERSKSMTGQNLLMFILFAFVVSILAQLGAYVCLVGIVASWPLMFTIQAVAYRSTFEGTPASVPVVSSGPMPY